MCGIAGLVWPRQASAALADPAPLLGKMLGTMVHRGPDADGIWVTRGDAACLGIGA